MHDLVFYYPEGHQAHFQPGHPERPERLEAIRRLFKDLGWWDATPRLAPIQVPESVLTKIHAPEYLKLLKAACRHGQSLDPDTFTTPASWELALHTAGGAAAVAEAVWKREARSGFALTRPPGHHATHAGGMGFCLLNNVAIASEYLLQTCGAQRLAIVDLDLHHGNGTQDIFYSRPEVLYISTHQYPFYPGTGWITDQGAGAGKGATLNLPLPAYSGDRAYLAAMSHVILPMLERFEPQALLVSVGFDTHWRDPIGQMLLSAGAYKQLIDALVTCADKTCDGRVALFLEGGYDLDASAACAAGCTAALLRHPWQDVIGASPHPEGTGWKTVIQQAGKLWELPRPSLDSDK